MRKVAVTGSNGFIGKNMVLRLRELGEDVVALGHDLDVPALAGQLEGVQAVIHLAGVNRPVDASEFVSGNVGMTEKLVAALSAAGGQVPVLYASSAQAGNGTAYGNAKVAAEKVLEEHARMSGAAVHISRLPNVFGKWCRPNYNSVVATFCYNIARGLPITVSDPAKVLQLVYVDDVVDAFLRVIGGSPATGGRVAVEPVYAISLGELADQIRSFRESRQTLVTSKVGSGFLRALHATYLSYLDPADFAYDLTPHSDARGMFVEMLRTVDSGQFSFFTAHPGVTRGEHYHHSKTEKFVVLQGRARFGFRHMVTGETFEVRTSGERPQAVETAPGWAHDITNVGDDTMIVMLWANEIFDPDRPDTIRAKVLQS